MTFNNEPDPILWSHASYGEDGRIWKWDTEHFIATVIGDGLVFQWSIENRLTQSGDPSHLALGRTRTFEESENAIREIVGKSYPRSCGYTKVAGRYAKIFDIVGGHKLDANRLDGKTCRVEVLNSDGSTRIYSGVLRVVHYRIEIIPPSGGTVEINPSHILHVHCKDAQADADTWLGLGRVHKGRVTPMCTGMPGIDADTVDHIDTRCPIHEPADQYGAVR